MPWPGRTESLPTLVVGAGLSGAALALLSASSGTPTILVSADRPASQATALARGIVHGVGPPGDALSWTRLTADVHASAAARAARGYDLLRSILLAAPRTVGLARIAHEVRPAHGCDATWTARALACLRAAGWPVEGDDRPDGGVIVRRHDALLDPRRLTFELLRQARARGARVRLGVAYRGVEDWRAVVLRVRLDTATLDVERLIWSAGYAMPDAPAPPASRPRLILHQLLEAGLRPLDAVLEVGAGELALFPDPLRKGRVVLVRRADEKPSGGLQWPELPHEWEVLRGAAVRQRLAEASSAPTDRPFTRLGPLVMMNGLSNWSVSSVLGACLDAVARDVGRA